MPGVAEFAKRALLHLMDAHNALIEACEFQSVYANQHRRKELLINEGDLVYLSTKNLHITLGRARKLIPRYLGPYKVIKTHHDHSVSSSNSLKTCGSVRYMTRSMLVCFPHSFPMMTGSSPIKTIWMRMIWELLLMLSLQFTKLLNIVGEKVDCNSKCIGTMVMLPGSH